MVIGGILLTMETFSVGSASSHSLCRAWRVNVAHDLKNVDPFTNVPLAARVCYNVAGLQFSFQADAFQNILGYQAGGSVGVGPLLSALCAFMWFTKVRPPPCDGHFRRLPVARTARARHAQVVHEVGEALTTSRAVARLHGKTTSFVGGVVASVSTPRLLCFLAMQALRVAVAVLLGYGGAFFIGHTIALSDLILNCIALEVRASLPPDRCCGRSRACWHARPLFGQHAPVWCAPVRATRVADKATRHSANPRCMMRRDRAV